MSAAIKELNQIRIDIDVLIKMAEQLVNSRHTSLGLTKLEEGRMHVGNTLFELKGITPYADSTDPKSERIDPYFQPKDLTPMAEPEDWNAGTHAANVKIMRREIDGIIPRLREVRPEMITSPNGYRAWVDAMDFKWEALVRLAEAKNWYGMELGRIRDERIQ